MRQVLFALLPGVAIYVWLYGFGVVIQILIAVSIALALEWSVLKLRRLEASTFISDGSVVVLACLLVLAMPPYAPWWTTVCGVIVAVLIGKHAYGGLGNNLFNPAMVGYVFVLLCFPVELSRWPSLERITDYLGPLDSFSLIFFPDSGHVDAISGATALDYSRTQITLMRTQPEIRSDPIYGVLGGRGWEWINLGFLAGGLWLCYQRVISWRIPVFAITGLTLTSTIFLAVDSDVYADPLFHLFSGAAILGAFFIATDPVSAATTRRGMIVYGAGVGILTYLVRNWGQFPDGVAFAILCMNAIAPSIDHFTQPRLYGQHTR